MYGNVRIKAISANNEALTEIRNRDAAGYKYIDFDDHVDSIKVDVFPGKKGLTMDIAIDSSWGPSIGQINIPDGGNGQTMQTLSAPIKTVKGKHAVWLRFWGDGDELLQIDAFRFL